jgi:hypothetical protein
LDEESADQVLKGVFEGTNGTCTCGGECAMLVWLVRLAGGLVEDVKESLDVRNLRVGKKTFVVLLKGLVD